MADIIEERFKRVIAEHLHVDLGKVADDATIELIGGDSLDAVEIPMLLQEEYDLKEDFPDSLYEKKTTVRNLWDYVQKYR
jgi:acyl carrier protein